MALPPTPQAPVISDLTVVGSQASFILTFAPGSLFLDANFTSYFQIDAYLPGASNWTLQETVLAPINTPHQILIQVPVQDGGADYSYRVKAVNALGSSEYSSSESVHVKGVPGQPTISGVNVILGSEESGVSAAKVRWYGDTVAHTYLIEYSSNPTGPFTTATTLPASAGTTFTINGLTNAMTYYFRVTEADIDGNWGAPSSAAPQLIGGKWF